MSDFDAKARTWDEDAAKRERAASVAEAIAARVPPLAGRRILEYGAGFTGHNGFDRADLQARLERAGFRGVRFATPHVVERETPAGTKRFPVFLAVAERA